MINADILKIANQASLNIIAYDQFVSIKHKLRLTDKSIWGVFLFLCGGLFFIIVPFATTSDTISKGVGIVIGVLLVFLSILTLVREVLDGIIIENNIFTFRHNLKKTTVPLSRDMKIEMKTEILKIRRVGTKGSDFILVTHYLQEKDKKTPVLKFQMNGSHAEKARKLGNEITRIVNDKFENRT
ncbi:hypothetical protein [Flavobacterium limi]|uniref:DUF304 domain-containing protein n=1 Tax=Flavobacterium limi TaxID=2045105 RepID=A0ABQ1TWZ0_9FLAO|nr:hypothetical protein [Flavobacterium limi]GGF05844.1 hypothetical protein GCM10011518_13850 [Flavobacterium limi]